ncbi:hypothetical protein D9619_002809 [Psilocybe cf. subviscida]|uniref:Uncharacterized protein n=1 Tax=Psilocybe cf. subviscida TaxID=2480587 RepID=A0A8H5AW02_9AGAR|nr:hypothetical protein D9619_002809 [Psilocybe cf. subviscida]
MFAHHHLPYSFRLCLHRSPRLVANTSGLLQRRGAAMTSSIPPSERAAARSPDAEPDFAEVEDLMDNPEASERSETPKSYREFMEMMGKKFLYATPQRYLGETPFPMNPSFKPPPPISDEQKEVIYQLYKSHRLENGPRRLAKQFNISLHRLNAILRLKIHEKEFEKKSYRHRHGEYTVVIVAHVLLTHLCFFSQSLSPACFQVGMEKLLGATTHSKVHSLKKTLAETDKFVDTALGTPQSVLDAMDPTSPHFQTPDINELRTDVHKADMLDQEEQRDVRASRYERMFWESVPEDGREPLLPSILQTARQQAEMRKLAKEVEQSKQFLQRLPDTKYVRHPKTRSLLVSRPEGRKGPITKFVDVGGKFMDLSERIKALGVTKNRLLRRRRLAEEKRAYTNA